MNKYLIAFVSLTSLSPLLLTSCRTSSPSASQMSSDPSTPKRSPENNGKILTSHVGRGMWIEIVIDGQKRLVQDALQYNEIFDGCLVVNNDLYSSIERGPHLGRDAQFIQDRETKAYYLVESNKKRLVSDPKKYCVKLANVKVLSHDDVEKIADGGNNLD